MLKIVDQYDPTHFYMCSKKFLQYIMKWKGMNTSRSLHNNVNNRANMKKVHDSDGNQIYTFCYKKPVYWKPNTKQSKI